MSLSRALEKHERERQTASAYGRQHSQVLHVAVAVEAEAVENLVASHWVRVHDGSRPDLGGQLEYRAVWAF